MIWKQIRKKNPKLLMATRTRTDSSTASSAFASPDAAGLAFELGDTKTALARLRLAIAHGYPFQAIFRGSKHRRKT